MLRRIRQLVVANSENASIASLIASGLAIVTAVLSALLSYHFTVVSQTRQAKLEQIIKFESSAAQIIEAGGQFIVAINGKKDLESAREKLSSVLATQVIEAQSISRMIEVRDKSVVELFETSLVELNQNARKTSSPDEMRPWAESFGRALDRKSELSKVLYSSI